MEKKMKISMKALYCISTIGLIAHEIAYGADENTTKLKDEVITLTNKFTNYEQVAEVAKRWKEDTNTYKQDINQLDDLTKEPTLEGLIRFVQRIQEEGEDLPLNNGEEGAENFKTIAEQLATDKISTGVKDLKTFLAYLEGDHFQDLRLKEYILKTDILNNTYIIPEGTDTVKVYFNKNDNPSEQQKKDKLKATIKAELIIDNITEPQIAEALQDMVAHEIPDTTIKKIKTKYGKQSSAKQEILKIYETMLNEPDIMKEVIEHNYGEAITDEIFKKLEPITKNTTKDDIITAVKEQTIHKIEAKDLAPYNSITAILTANSITNVDELPANKEINLSTLYNEAEIVKLIAAQHAEIDNKKQEIDTTKAELNKKKQELKAGIQLFNKTTGTTIKDTYTLTNFLKELAKKYNHQGKIVTKYNDLISTGATNGMKGAPLADTKEVIDLRNEVARLKDQLKQAQKNAGPIVKPEQKLTQEEQTIIQKKIEEVNDKVKAKTILKKLGIL